MGVAMQRAICALVSAVLSAGLAPLALAADVAPQKTAVPEHLLVRSWTGFHAGANVGYGWADVQSDFSFTGAGNIPLGSSSSNVSGVIGGVQAGYDWQTGNLVFGLETDVQMTGQSGSSFASCPAGVPCGVGGGIRHTEKLVWFGTTRGRVGTTFDGWLVYLTAGAAYGQIKADGVANFPIVPGATMAVGGSETRFGWTVGAGLEGLLVANWSWRVEYLYMDLGNVFLPTATAPPFVVPATLNQSFRFRNNIVRLAINYRL
jgi:outer membrane immunogenic protein